MRRRPLLRALPAAGSLVLAGCLDDVRAANESGHVVLLATDGSVRSTAGGTDMDC